MSSPSPNSQDCIATFYSHFGAVRFKRQCTEAGLKARMMPVPRDLSSSCGTCVRFEAPQPLSAVSPTGEMEQMVLITEEGYQLIYRSENG